MAEVPGPSENLGSPSGKDGRHSKLLANFLFAGDSGESQTALGRLQVDNSRRAAGMAEQERGTAEVIDWAKENGPKIAKEGALAVGPAVLTAAVWETIPQFHQTVERVVSSGLTGGIIAAFGGEIVRRVAELHPRFSKVAEFAVVFRSVGLVFTQISASAGIGIVGVELLDRAREAFSVFAAVSPSLNDYYHGVSDVNLPKSFDPPNLGDYYHGVDDVNLPAAEQRPKLSADEAAFLNQVGHPELAEANERLAAEQAAQDAARQALLSGKTIGELAEITRQIPWNVVRDSVGNSPHGGEISNVLTRALQAGGVDISGLHEGAISQLTAKMQELFGSADKALEAFNLGHPYAPRPYDAGGLGAVETVKGLNSIEAQAIRAANLGDMEAAGNLYNNVLRDMLNP